MTTELAVTVFPPINSISGVVTLGVGLDDIRLLGLEDVGVGAGETEAVGVLIALVFVASVVGGVVTRGSGGVTGGVEGVTGEVGEVTGGVEGVTGRVTGRVGGVTGGVSSGVGEVTGRVEEVTGGVSSGVVPPPLGVTRVAFSGTSI